MITKLRVLRRASYTFVALTIMTAAAMPILQPKLASAEQLGERSITLSDSGASAGAIPTGIGSGTDVSYQVSFKTNTDGFDADYIIIDFCQNTPIIGDTCDEAIGMDVSTVALEGTDPVVNSAGWTVAGNNPNPPTVNNQRVILTKDTGTPIIGDGSTYTFDLTGIINPSTTGTFYARIYTYANATTFAGYVDPETLGTYVDYGGIALSTNQIITITAKVQEQLTFCVSGAAHNDWDSDPVTGGEDCSSPGAAELPALTLGHGTPTEVLTADQTDQAAAFSQISTNATNGAVITLRNSNAGITVPCGGLSANGEDCAIPSVNSGAGTIGTIIPGTAAFGVAVNDGVPAFGPDNVTPVGTGTVLADLNYAVVNGTETDLEGVSTVNKYGMDEETTTDAGSVIGTYGDIVASSIAPLFRINNTYTFGATASLTTPAGVYIANIDLVATGTF